MPHSYELSVRETHEHRAGHHELLIDGIDGEITVDPSQFMKKALRESLGDPVAATAICERYARRAIERRIERLKEGRVQTAGVTAVVEASRKQSPKRVGEDEAVTRFLSRGYEKNEHGIRVHGLDGQHVRRTAPRTREESERRRKIRNQRADFSAEWLDRRKALIAKRESELSALESEMQAASPDKAAKLAREVSRLKDELARLKTPGSDNPAVLQRIEQIANCERELSELAHLGLRYPDAAASLAARIAALRDRIRELKAPVLAASHGFQFAYGEYFNADTDLVTGDVRIVPCMTNTTVDTQRDAIDQVSDFTTLDEFDGSGYSTGGQALDNQAVNIDDANDRAEFDADDEAATLGAGTRSIQGNLLIEFISTLNGSLPLHWIEYSANKTPDGSTFTVVFNAEGILQAADG